MFKTSFTYFTAIYENDGRAAQPTGIMPNRYDDDEGDYYSDVDVEDAEYENVPTNINGIIRGSEDVPPIPPPKDYKPEVPPKAIQVPMLPPKQDKVRKHQELTTNSPSQSPAKPVRRKHKDNSPNVPRVPNKNKEILTDPIVTKNVQRVNISNGIELTNNGIDHHSELMKKLEERKRKNEQRSNIEETHQHRPKPTVPVKNITVTAPKLLQRAGKESGHSTRYDDRPLPLPRTVRH